MFALHRFNLKILHKFKSVLVRLLFAYHRFMIIRSCFPPEGNPWMGKRRESREVTQLQVKFVFVKCIERVEIFTNHSCHVV